MINQVVKLQAEMSEIKTPLATLTQQVISRTEKGNAQRASSSRTQERIDKHCYRKAFFGLGKHTLLKKMFSVLHQFFSTKLLSAAWTFIQSTANALRNFQASEKFYKIFPGRVHECLGFLKK